MDDLISRKAVIDLLKKSASRDIEEVVVTEKNIKLIMDMPKAFDVDAVVAEIAEKAQKYCDAVGCKNCYTDCEHYFLMQSIIASVVKGGVE